MVLSKKEKLHKKLAKLFNSQTCYEFRDLSECEVIIEVKDKNTHLVKEVLYISITDSEINDLDVRSAFEKLETLYRKNHIGVDYKIISMGGYVGGNDYIKEKQYEQFGLQLFDSSYLDQELPIVDLIAHNQYTYNQVLNLLSLGVNDICSVQPTGTGKSFLIGKYVSDFVNNRVLILSPSIYILEQFKKTFSWMNDNKNIRMMTYAKLSVLSEEEWADLILFNPKSICVDEYHRLGASAWGSSYKYLVNTLRHDVSSYGLRTFGVTATPKRFLDKNRDMSNELFDGNVANEITLYDAIARSILPMPKYVTVFHDISFDIERLKKKIANSKNTSEEKINLKSKLKDIIKKWTSSLSVVPIIQKYVTDERKFIVFCESQEHVDEMIIKCKEWFEVAFNGQIPVNTYKMLSSYRDSSKEYEEFENADNNSFNLLFSINAINEGVHPNIDAVIFCRNTTSGIIYYQQQGRCFKVGGGKTPLILDLVNNAYNIGEVSFKSRVQESIDNENSRRSEVGLSPVDSYIDYKHSVIDESQEVLKMFAELEDRLLTSWDESYLKAKQYFEKHNHVYVDKEEDEHLCSWLSKLRTLHKNGKLDEEKIKKLKLLNFDFELKDYLFNKHYVKLEKFFLEFGHSRVPNTYTDLSLYNWVTSCRAKYAQNELEQWQIDKLNVLSFVWNVNDYEWDLGFEELKEYYKLNGHSNVTQSNATDRLFNFRNRNKKMFREGKLSEERLNLLKTVEFDFSGHTDHFEDRLKRYEGYIKKYNNPLVEKSNDPTLHSWLTEVRKNYKKNKLSEDKIDRLEGLGMIWDILEHKWITQYNAMKNYYSTHGNLEINVRSEDAPLYKWMQIQRREYLSGKISEKRKQLLDSFDFITKILAVQKS